MITVFVDLFPVKEPFSEKPNEKRIKRVLNVFSQKLMIQYTHQIKGVRQMSLSQEATKVLGMVIDTCTHLSIVDMGLIEDIQIDEDAKTVKITMLPTTPFCMFLSGMEMEIEVLFAENDLLKDYKVSFEKSAEPWTKNRLSDKAKEQLYI